jgi:hypothetical protein
LTYIIAKPNMHYLLIVKGLLQYFNNIAIAKIIY